MKIALLIDGDVGQAIANIFKKNNFPVHLLICTQKSGEDYASQIKKTVQHKEFHFYETWINTVKDDQKIFDLGILCWWPFIIKKKSLSLATRGYINFHPSFLPYGRGKYGNFWTFVEDTPFGVTLHWADESIDGGAIAFQKEITKEWTDTGYTLYEKACASIIKLFEENFHKIVNGDIPKKDQDANLPVHYSQIINEASKINLEHTYKARELINLIRARTFEGHPGTWFEDKGKIYEMRISITEKKI